MKHKKTKGWLLLAVAALCIQTISALAAPRPNILYLYVDDMGWGSIGPNGQAARIAAGLPHVLTPNIDKLADQGINFAQAYGCTVCSPARSSQQSGFHQGHTYADRNNTDNAKKAMRADDILMGDVLSAAGYVTGYWGKWGYGSESTQVNPAILNLQTLPTSHGYQHVLTELHHVRAHTFFQPTLWSAPATPGALGGLELIPNSMANYTNNSAYPEFPANQSDTNYPTTAYCDDAYAFAALDFIRTQAQNYNETGQPFFGLLAGQVPHSPYDEIVDLPEWDGSYDTNAPFHTLEAGGQAQQWAAMITRIDAHYGNLLAALEDPNNDGDTSDSVVENTIVIFQSDNGGPGNAGRTSMDANGGLRGTKGGIYDGGIRVPLVIRWPAMIHSGSSLQAGTESTRVVDVTDLLPTFCDLAGVETPLSIDGVSIAPLLTGTGQQRNRDFVIHEAGSANSIIRGKYKLVGSGTLYDLDADHAESTNIAATHPDLVAELYALKMGERVTEPQWFANTYHHWIGTDGANLSEAANWSDYEYVNALNSITYISETGAPRERWTAKLINTNVTAQTAVLDADVSVLGIEIAGKQTLSIVPGNTLTGRNEIRLSPLSTVELNGGTLASTRWVDLLADATLQGPGTIDAILYNAGTLDITTNMLGGTTYTTNIIPGSGGEETIQFNRFSNTDLSSVGAGGTYSAEGWISTDGGSSPNASAVYDVSTFIVENSTAPQPLTYTVTGLNIDGDGGDNDRVVINFSVSTDGQLLRTVWDAATSTPKNAGWLSSGGTTLNANGEYVQFDFTSLSIDLNGGTGNGHGSFDGFSHVGFGSFTVAGEVSVANGLTQALTAGKDLDLTGGGLDANLQVIYDTAQGSVGGGYRPEVWSFQISTSGDPIPAVTNIVTNVVSSAGVVVSQDYYQSNTALLDVPLFGVATSLVVNGSATLDGRLECSLPAEFAASNGDRFTIISASSVTGSFTNPDGMIESGGHHFRILYSADQVELEKVAVTTAGTPHWWMDLYGLTNDTYEAEDLLDIDGDGLSAWEEYIAGTLPDQASSVFQVKGIDESPGVGFVVRWSSVDGRIYNLYSSTNLSVGEGFQSLDPADIPATPPENTYTDATEKAESFYRVQTEKN